MPRKKQEDKKIHWRAPEFRSVEKSFLWYAGIAIVGAVLFIIALVQGNFFFAVFIALAGTLLTVFSKREPSTIEFSVTEEGISIGSDYLYEYGDLEGFMIQEYENNEHELILKRKTAMNPFLRIPLSAKLAPKVRDMLISHIEEQEYEDSLIDSLARIVGL